MSESWVEIDDLPEELLPPHARDERSGDRVSFLEAGLLSVRGGRATFARWSEMLGVVEHAGSAYVLVPRRPPAHPWIEIEASLLGGEPDALSSFVTRVRERGAGGGYRDAVRQRRQGLVPGELKNKIVRRDAIPGALEVPSTIVLGRSYPGLGFVQAAVLMSGGFLGYFGMFALIAGVETASRGAGGPLVMFLSIAPLVGLVLGALAAREIGRRWRAAKDRDMPRQRVLVLAPDGCVVGFRTGVQTLPWSMVGSFAIGPTEPSYELGLVVKGSDDEAIGDLDAGWLDAPLSLVVAVAEAYRRSAG